MWNVSQRKFSELARLDNPEIVCTRIRSEIFYDCKYNLEKSFIKTKVNLLKTSETGRQHTWSISSRSMVVFPEKRSYCIVHSKWNLRSVLCLIRQKSFCQKSSRNTEFFIESLGKSRSSCLEEGQYQFTCTPINLTHEILQLSDAYKKVYRINVT